MKSFRYALLAACAAALVFVTTTALAGSGAGATFNLGETNSVNVTSTLSGATAAPQLTITNTSTNSAATALSLLVPLGHPPFKVNSSIKVLGLNADLLDGRDSTALPYWKVGGNAGTSTSNFIGTTDAKPLVFRTNGAQVMTIDSTGRVGIPTTESASLLKVSTSVQGLIGIDGVNSNSVDGTGVAGQGPASGVHGTSLSGFGVYGWSGYGAGVHGNSSFGRGVMGTLGTLSCPGTYAVGGCGGASYGVYGKSTSYEGVHGESSSGSGVVGGSTDGVGVYGYSTNGSAGYFEGNVTVGGTLTAGAKNFKIDHPLDPAHKYLQHTSVESPDMLDIYNGNVTTDGKGFATVRLPSWFQALNRTFRYQLTILGRSFAQAIVWREIHDNEFTIRTNQPGVRVSWQVTGVRHDRYANAHRVQVVVPKAASDRGKYLYPQLYGKPRRAAIGFEPAARTGAATR